MLPAASARGTRYDLPMVGERVEIELFAGERLIAEGREVRDGLDGVRTWIADIEGGGLVTLTRDRKGGLAGVVERLPHIYNLQRGRDGKLYALDIDQRALPPDDLDEVADVSLKLAPLPSASAKSVGSAAIDLLVVYTPAVAARYDASLLAQNGVANLNAAMQYAGIDVTVNLVAVEQTGYTEHVNDAGALFGEALTDLAGGLHGLDQAHLLRSVDYGYGADLVLLLIDGSLSSTSCGNASYPILQRTYSQLRNDAYAVVADHCVISSHTLAHEVGHLLSARHARGDSQQVTTSQARHPYSFGYIHDPTNASGAYFRTIMAIGQNCTITDCLRVLRWSDSNSQHRYYGHPLGVSRADTSNSADNAYAIADFAPTVASYNTPTPLAPPVAPQPFSVQYLCGGINRASWGESPGVEYFELYKKPAGATNWTRIYSGLQHSFDLMVTVNTSLQVRACNGAGCSGLLGGLQAVPAGYACP